MGLETHPLDKENTLNERARNVSQSGQTLNFSTRESERRQPLEEFQVVAVEVEETTGCPFIVSDGFQRAWDSLRLFSGLFF